MLLISLRLGLTHTRLNGLRAANSSLSVGVLFVASVSLSLSLSLSSVFGLLVPCQSLGSPGASGNVYVCFLFSLLLSPSVCCLPLTSVFGGALVFSSSSRPLSS